MKKITDLSFSDIADVYVEAIRKGYPIEPQTLANEFPHFTRQIMEELPAIALLEKSLRIKPIEPSGKELLPNIPGYAIGEEIGRGAVGIVYKATHETSGKTVAVKVLPHRAFGSMGERVEIEKIAMSRLSHPNIVSILSYGSTDRLAYIVMKLVDGVSLDQLMAPKPGLLAVTLRNRIKNDWELFAQIGLQVASGLQHAHSKDLVHRDIKPANLLIDKQENAWIADFGLAKLMDHLNSLSRTGDIIGTPRFMAPEQMRGIIDCRNDIYSLGWTLYELAQTFSEKRLIENGRSVLPICEMNPAVPTELGFIIDKACSMAPEERYQTAEEMRFVLQRFVDGLPKSDRRRSKNRLSNSEYRLLESRRNKIIVGVAMASGLAMGGFWFSMGKSERESPNPQVVMTQTPEDLAGRNMRRNPNQLLSEAVDGDAGFVDFVGEVFKSSLEDGDPDPEKQVRRQEVAKKIDTIVDRVKKEGVNAEKLDSIMNGYRDSSLPMAKKIGMLVVPLHRSNLSADEKRLGSHTIQLFARSVINNHIATDEAEHMLGSLFRGKVPKIDQIQSTPIKDNALRSWLRLVNETLGNRLKSAAVEQERSPEVVNEILDKFLKEY